MKNQQHQRFFERFRQAKDHGAFDDRRGHQLRRILYAEPHNPTARELAESRIHRIEKLRAEGVLPPFKASHLDAGAVLLGQDVHGHPVRIDPNWLCSGVLLVANTGSGKSNFISWLGAMMAVLESRLWYFELYKIQLRRLQAIYQRLGKNLIILPWQNLRWNLLQCHGGDPRHHAATAVDLLVRTLNLPGRASAILRHGIHELYGRFNVWQAEATEFPTLFHLYEWVRAQGELNVAARDAILDRLGAFLLSLTPACGAWTKAWSPQDLARHNIVFEMRGSSESVRCLLPQSILFSVFHARINAGLVNVPLELLVIFEDSQRLFEDGRIVEGGDVAAFDELASVVRGAGLGFWANTQTTVGFSRRLRLNTALKIFGRLGGHEDYAVLGADCGLNQEQLDHVRRHLTPGTFVGQTTQGNWTEPFLFQIPLAHLPDHPSEECVQASQLPLADVPTTFAQEFARWSPHPVVEVKTPETEPKTGLTANELAFLRAVVAHPGQKIGYYCKLTRFSGKRLAELRLQLQAAGYLREHAVNEKSRGRAAIILEPLAPAHAAVHQSPIS